MYLFLCLFKIIFLAWFISNRKLLFVSWPLLGIHQKTAAESCVCSVLPWGQLPTQAPASGAKGRRAVRNKSQQLLTSCRATPTLLERLLPWVLAACSFLLFQRPGQDCLRAEKMEKMEKNLKRENNVPHSYWASDVSFPESPGRASWRGSRLVLVPSVRVCCLETRLEDVQGNKNAKFLPLQWLPTLWLPSPVSPAGDSLKNPHIAPMCAYFVPILLLHSVGAGCLPRTGMKIAFEMERNLNIS